MALINSATGAIRRAYTVDQLKSAANEMRGYNLIALNAAGSGHSGGTLSFMDIAAALYLHVANHDPENPNWEQRDRILWSAGHKAPALYVSLGYAGFCPMETVMTLRKLGSPCQGHPDWFKMQGVEISTGSLGQGLSISVGMALAARLDKRTNKIFCIMSDGEQQEGSVWEAIMEAAHHKLDNIIAIVDQNFLQIDGWVRDVMGVEPLADKYRAFGWNVIEIDGHNMEEIVAALNKARLHTGQPTVIIATTIKGKGVSFMENQVGWHGKPPSRKELDDALAELGLSSLPVDTLLAGATAFQAKNDAELAATMPRFNHDYWWNTSDETKVKMDPNRKGLGQALAALGSDPRIVCLGLDISGSITISDFYAKHPERKERWFSMGIAEQSATAAAAGLAREGKIPVVGSYATFMAARNLDQIRVSVCYSKQNVLIVGAHGGVSVGPDGATHQALEDLAVMQSLPGMSVVVPADTIEAVKAMTHLLLKQVGPKYIRFAREATPVISNEQTPFVFAKANLMRLRSTGVDFASAFDTQLAADAPNEKEDLSIIAIGPMVPEAMRAALILKREFGFETRVLNMHTLKPLDCEAVLRAARETGVVITAEEHQIGALAWKVSGCITENAAHIGRSVLTGAIGVKDRFGESGAPWELVKRLEVSAEHIATRAVQLMKQKKS